MGENPRNTPDTEPTLAPDSATLASAREPEANCGRALGIKIRRNHAEDVRNIGLSSRRPREVKGVVAQPITYGQAPFIPSYLRIEANFDEIPLKQLSTLANTGKAEAKEYSLSAWRILHLCANKATLMAHKLLICAKRFECPRNCRPIS